MTLTRKKPIGRGTSELKRTEFRSVSPKKLAAGLRLPSSTFKTKPKTERPAVEKLPLPVAPWREAPAPKLAAPKPVKRRPRDTGPTKATRDAVKARDKRCVRCGREVLHGVAGLTYSIQHILGRGAGGCIDPQVNDVDWLVLLCGDGTSGCHGEVEGKYRRRAYAEGHARKRTAIDRHLHTLKWHGRRCRLHGGLVFDATNGEEVRAS